MKIFYSPVIQALYEAAQHLAPADCSLARFARSVAAAELGAVGRVVARLSAGSGRGKHSVVGETQSCGREPASR